MLQEEGKDIVLAAAKALLNFLIKHTGNLGRELEQKIKTEVIDTGKMSIKSFIRSGGTPDFIHNLDPKKISQIGTEMKKLGLKFSVIPENEEGKYKICYDIKYAKLIEPIVDKYVKKDLDKKEPLESQLARAKELMQKDMQTRSEPLKHREVNIR